MRRAFVISLALAVLTMLAPDAARAQEGGQIHVVQRGENLYRIALRYGVSVNRLAMINGISNPSLIFVGQRLVIPASTFNDSAAAAQPTATPTPITSDTFALDDSAPVAATTDITTTEIITPTQNISPTVVFAPTATPNISAGTARTHVVAPGENLYRIALRYGLTTNQLAAANSISEPGLINVGQVLRIPAPGQSLAVTPEPAASGANSGKKIVVSISKQHLWAYENGRLVYSFVVSTGLAKSPTKIGNFKVLDKIPNAYASTWNLQMPYWLGIYYGGKLENGIHALPILPNGQRLWEGLLGRPASFGCVILETSAAKKLYDWAEVGIPVIIQP